jgi:thymidylate kinase
MTSKLIAFCGIDGAGKTTLVRMLAERRAISAIYLKKDHTSARDLVAAFHAPARREPHDWEVGPFAAAIALATAVDFLAYYAGQIAPALKRGGAVVVDRYTPCYQAYLDSTEYPYDASLMFAGVRAADLIVYIDTPYELALRRCLDRGGGTEDESPGLLRRFAAAYQRVLARTAIPVLRIDNSAAIEASYARVAAELAAWLSDRTSSGRGDSA